MGEIKPPTRMTAASSPDVGRLLPRSEADVDHLVDRWASWQQAIGD
jgi:hypothetical protein